MPGYLALVSVDHIDFNLSGLYQLNVLLDSQAKIIQVRWKPQYAQAEQQSEATDADPSQAGALPI